EHVEHVALGDLADRHGDRAAGVGDGGAAHQAVGRLHGDRPGGVVTQVLLDLQGQRPGPVVQGDIDLEGVVDVGHVIGAELHVYDGADDPGDPAGLRAGSGGCGHDDTHSFPAEFSASALAPPTISLISWVISAWRALLASRVNCSSRSLALSVADFIARRRAAISEAAASSSAW